MMLNLITYDLCLLTIVLYTDCKYHVSCVIIKRTHVYLKCRQLEISRESHKLIDAKVQKQGLDIISEPFEFGMCLPMQHC